MRSTKMTLWLVALIGLAACGEETPVELGGLIPGGGVRTGEAVFAASDFLAWDSVKTGFMKPVDASFIMAAHQFGGTGGEDSGLDARGLVRFQNLPQTLSYTDGEGTTHVDTIPNLVSGRITFRVDTLRSVFAGPGSMEVAVYQVGESWDSRTANWTSRQDTGSVQLPWAEAGGTHGNLLDTSTLLRGDSVLTFDLDAATLAVLQDTTENARGVLVQVQTPGARLELGAAYLHFDARPAAKQDTLMADSVGMRAKTFLLNPLPDVNAAGALLVGGLPTWRSYLRFKEGIDTLRVPCPGGSSGCMLSLADVVVNYAGLELQHISGPPGLALVDTTFMEPRTVLPIDGVPIARAPLGVRIGDLAMNPPTLDLAPGSKVAVPVTMLVASMAGDSLARANAPRTVILLAAPEGGSAGVAAFGSLTSGPLAPRLRVIYSVTKEVQDQ